MGSVPALITLLIVHSHSILAPCKHLKLISQMEFGGWLFSSLKATCGENEPLKKLNEKRDLTSSKWSWIFSFPV